jgi:uncharacterized membrane protein
LTASADLPPATVAARLACAGVVALAVLLVLWEAWLAPLRPGGSWLVLKALPLLLVAPGVLRGARKARQWAALILPWYLAEAVVRAWSEHGRASLVAAIAGVLAVASFVALLAWFRAERAGAR